MIQDEDSLFISVLGCLSYVSQVFLVKLESHWTLPLGSKCIGLYALQHIDLERGKKKKANYIKRNRNLNSSLHWISVKLKETKCGFHYFSEQLICAAFQHGFLFKHV